MNEGWIEWKGGECPVSGGTGVEMRNRNGDTWAALARDVLWNESWSAYRVVSLAMPPLSVMVQADSALDVQIGGDHYKGMSIQPVEYIHANGLGFVEGSVVKYVSRWKEKGGIADLEKAQHFLGLLIELETKKAAK